MTAYAIIALRGKSFPVTILFSDEKDAGDSSNQNESDDLKVAFMSVLEISEKRKETLLSEGLSDYILKPFDKDTLLNTVDRILQD
jgi:CheY-like chemotaxis protein